MNARDAARRSARSSLRPVHEAGRSRRGRSSSQSECGTGVLDHFRAPRDVRPFRPCGRIVINTRPMDR